MHRIRPVQNEEKHPNALQSPYFKRILDGRRTAIRAPIVVNQPLAAPIVQQNQVTPPADAKNNVVITQHFCSCVIL